MVLITGACAFQEARARTNVTLFALCDIGKVAQLIPISLPAHKSVSGIECLLGGRYLALKPESFPSRLNRVLIGLSVPTGHTLDEEDFRLQLRFNDGTPRMMHPAIGERGVGKRHALLAAVLLMPADKTWNAIRLDQPALFATKDELSESYPVPKWWC